jgi:hypothetical protein
VYLLFNLIGLFCTVKSIGGTLGPKEILCGQSKVSDDQSHHLNNEKLSINTETRQTVAPAHEDNFYKQHQSFISSNRRSSSSIALSEIDICSTSSASSNYSRRSDGLYSDYTQHHRTTNYSPM